MSPDEVVEFERHLHRDAAIRLRRWDDTAKIPELSTPPLSHFRQYLEQAAAAAAKEAWKSQIEPPAAAGFGRFVHQPHTA